MQQSNSKQIENGCAEYLTAADFFGSQVDYVQLKIEVASRFVASMLSNPDVFSHKSLEKANSEQYLFEARLVAIAHDLAVTLIEHCIHQDTEDYEHS
jgi:hypothetical protein